MKLSQYFSKQPLGSRRRFADAVGVATTFLYQMENGLKPVPPLRVLDIAKATDWKVTPHDLRPDIYPNSTDGMPAEARPKMAAGED